MEASAAPKEVWARLGDVATDLLESALCRSSRSALYRTSAPRRKQDIPAKAAGDRSRPIAAVRGLSNYRRMNALLPLVFLVAASTQPSRSQSYLVSIVDVPLQADESIERFSLSTGGLSFQAVCKLPEGWTIKAGSSIRGDGVLEGEGSNGVTWLPRSSPPELDAIALVTLDIESAPNSFSGSATLPAWTGSVKSPSPATTCASQPPVDVAGGASANRVNHDIRNVRTGSG